MMKRISSLNGAMSVFVALILSLTLVTSVSAGPNTAIDITSNIPNECQLLNQEIIVSGTATADAPPGLTSQYHVQVSWGDGTSDDVAENSSFGPEDPSTRNFASSKTYSTPGNYTVTARIYHQNVPGNDGQAAAVESFQLCIVSPLVIEKTATTDFDREWSWTIDKSSDDTTLNLAKNEIYSSDYNVIVGASSSDSNFVVSGTISITNPAGNPTIQIQEVTDTLSEDGVVDVVCPDGLPQSLLEGEILVCTYSKNLLSANDQKNQAYVDTDKNILDSYSNEVDVVFGEPTTETDECVDVTDDKYGILGTVCANELADGEYAFDQYSLNVDSSTCGVTNFVNTASFVTNDNAMEGSDNHSIEITVDCIAGCTLTQGYWKTHNEWFKDGKNADEAWDSIIDPNLRGVSWYSIFWTAPKNGNIWYQLAHQWMAAKLNEVNDAEVPPNVLTALNGAGNWLANIGTPSTNLKGKAETEVKGWISILGSYNEGSIGPGHCDENPA